MNVFEKMPPVQTQQVQVGSAVQILVMVLSFPAPLFVAHKLVTREFFSCVFFSRICCFISPHSLS